LYDDSIVEAEAEDKKKLEKLGSENSCVEERLWENENDIRMRCFSF